MTDVFLPRDLTAGTPTVIGLSAFPRPAPASASPDETDINPSMNPYAFLAEHPDLSMELAPLPPGQRGRWYPDLHVILISNQLTQAERRCTLTHELVHRMRGDLHIDDDLIRNRLERSCHQIAARLLLPLPKLAEVLVWSECPSEAAEALFVDVETLQTRLESLHPAERGFLRRSIAMKEATA